MIYCIKLDDTERVVITFTLCCVFLLDVSLFCLHRKGGNRLHRGEKSFKTSIYFKKMVLLHPLRNVKSSTTLFCVGVMRWKNYDLHPTKCMLKIYCLKSDDANTLQTTCNHYDTRSFCRHHASTPCGKHPILICLRFTVWVTHTV
jgi:hypothetical protein